MAILNCLLARQLCFEDASCSAILEIIPRVCGSELGAVHADASLTQVGERQMSNTEADCASLSLVPRVHLHFKPWNASERVPRLDNDKSFETWLIETDAEDKIVVPTSEDPLQMKNEIERPLLIVYGESGRPDFCEDVIPQKEAAVRMREDAPDGLA
ncbi:jg17447 [Pararge aegeria aegeria]|uniref:Jg17447 protein n=1 Tax=Pararge aegeria aegeria TaxID=348720 RepID=A0A8S4S4Z5_9NEOP|nr:jg17447 [Pararge aegeria aegeria]